MFGKLVQMVTHVRKKQGKIFNPGDSNLVEYQTFKPKKSIFFKIQ
jgi:hypothetical protein